MGLRQFVAVFVIVLAVPDHPRKVHMALLRVNTDIIFDTSDDSTIVCDALSIHGSIYTDMFVLRGINARVVDFEILSSDEVPGTIAALRGWDSDE